jgi:predicted RNA-binding Zn-ribbon protein involved in translation (DUF1610 family)
MRSRRRDTHKEFARGGALSTALVDPAATGNDSEEFPCPDCPTVLERDAQAFLASRRHSCPTDQTPAASADEWRQRRKPFPTGTQGDGG